MSRKPNTKKVEFAPNKAYAWEPTDEFILTGLEIDKINKALSAMAQSPEFQRHVMLYEGLMAFNQFFRTAVEEGAIKEQPQSEENGQGEKNLAVVREEPAIEVEAEEVN